MSPLLFTLYLAKTLEPDTQFNESLKIDDEHNYSKHRYLEPKIPTHLIDHNYQKIQDYGVNLHLEFADDLSRLNSYEDIVDTLLQEDSEKLQKRHFIINQEKTEKYKINTNSDESWKKIKYLGSLLGTKEDIIRRKQLAMMSYNKYKNILE